MKFPKQVFVTIEEEGRETYMLVSKTQEDAFSGTNDANEPVKIAVYKLDRVELVARELKSVVTT